MQENYLGSYNSIPLDLTSINSIYKVQVKTSQNTLDYTLKVQYQDTLSHLLLTTKNFKINNESPDLMTDQLAHKCGEILYPLKLSITREGEIHKIANYEELKNKWKNLKPKLALYYKDTYSINYIQRQDEIYHSPQLLLSKIKDTPFFISYFQGIYNKSLGDNLCREYKKEIKGLEFDCIQKVASELGNNSIFSIITELDCLEMRENIYLHTWLNTENKTIEKLLYIYIKNREVVMEMNIEKQQTEKKSVKKNHHKEESPEIQKLSRSFWIDEKNYN